MRGGEYEVKRLLQFWIFSHILIHPAHATNISERNCGHGMVRLRELASSWDNVDSVGHLSELYALDNLYSSPTRKLIL